MSNIKEISSSKCFDGLQKSFSHQSDVLNCQMKFSIFVPPKAIAGQCKVPVMYWLNGFFSNEMTFPEKGGFQRYAAEKDLCVVCPDAGPRKAGEDKPISDDPGWYLDGTQEGYKSHKMFTYVTKELISVIESNFDFVLAGKRSVCGRSLGGLGALLCALKNPGLYTTVTTFAAACNPVKNPVCIDGYKRFFGDDEATWLEWDPTHLIANYTGPNLKIFIDQGSSDPFINILLHTNFLTACQTANKPVRHQVRDGYDHGWFHVASFIEKHLTHHRNALYGIDYSKNN